VIVALAVGIWAAESKGDRTIHHSTGFGWEANQDVTEAFTKLLQDGTLKAGDELVPDHTYRIDIMGNSQRVLPDKFRLSAVKSCHRAGENRPPVGGSEPATVSGVRIRHLVGSWQTGSRRGRTWSSITSAGLAI